MGLDSAGSRERLSALRLPRCCLHTDGHKERFSQWDIKRRKWKYEAVFDRKPKKKRKVDLVCKSERLNTSCDHRPARSLRKT